MSIENESERGDRTGMSLRRAQLISLELAWKFYFYWLDLPDQPRLKFSNWLNVTNGNLDEVVGVMEKVAETGDCTNPSYEIWKILRNHSAPRPRHSDSDRVRTWQAPQGSA